MNQFKKDQNYLLNYCIRSILLFSILILLIANFKGIELSFHLTEYSVYLPLLGILLCGLPSSILHNCAHGNIKPHWLNQLVGELCGTFMLYGFKGFQVGHMFHHIYPDNPVYDPHPPRGYSFLRFVISPIEATLRVIEKGYFDSFGENEKTRRSIKIQTYLFNVGIVLRLMFLFLLLGPVLFTFLYLPIYIGNIFVFAHINYATHVENENGDSEIINLDHNLYYKFVNIVSYGGYFHKSHHLKPQQFDPSQVILKSEKRYITYSPPINVMTPARKPLFHLGLIHGLKRDSYVK
jgi:fatty acid desaturase